jgi:predicted AlkP superfamily phosphohydrolase/phosphomutase
MAAMSLFWFILSCGRGAIVAGFVAGSVLTSLALVLFPYFFGHFYELVLFPIAVAFFLLLASIPGQLFKPRQPNQRLKKGRSRRLTTLILVTGLVPLLLYAGRASTRAWGAPPKVLIYCIDSATWDIAAPLIEAGHMSALSGIRDRGVGGILQSTDPSFSPIVWTSIATGVTPDVHGITNFYATQNNLRSKRIWDVLEEHGHSTGVFRWFVTWPPRRSQGFVIPGILARDAASYPAKYASLNKLRTDQKMGHSTGGLGGMMAIAWQFLNAGLRLETSMLCAKDLGHAYLSGSKESMHIAMRHVELRLNTDVFCHLLRETNPAFATFYDNGVDVLGHYYWKFFEPDLFPGVPRKDVDALGSAIPDFCKLVDQSLAQVLDHVDPSTTIIVLSDHGQRADTEAGGKQFYPKADQLLAALEEAASMLSNLAVNDMPLLHVQLRDEDRILIWVNIALKSIDQTIEIDGKPHELADLLTAREPKSGTHDPDGIYAMSGPAIANVSPGPRLQLTDVAPTVLYLAGAPLSRELKGEVAWGTIATSYRESNAVTWVDSYGEYQVDEDRLSVDPETMKKLRSLGYVR